MAKSDTAFHSTHDFLGALSNDELHTTHDFLEVFDNDELWDDLLVDTATKDAPTEAIVSFSASTQRRRVTPKDNINRLHDEIQQLSAQLQALVTAAGRRNPHTRCRRSELWHQLAIRQLVRRRNSENENRELREMVRLQIDEAKSLRRILKRRTRIQRLQDMLEGTYLKRLNPTTPLAVTAQESEQVFEEMKRDVRGLYEKLDALFTEKGMHSISCPGRKRQTDSTLLNGVCFELTQREIVPFGMDKVKNAVWSSLGQSELEGLRTVGGFKTHVQFRKLNSDQDSKTALVSFMSAITSGRTARVRGRKIVRQYDEESRTVFIYQTSIEPTASNGIETVGVNAISTLVLEIRPGDLDDDFTLIQSHFSVTRYDEGLAAGQQLGLAVNLQISIAVWKETVSRIHEQVESHLMDISSTRVIGAE